MCYRSGQYGYALHGIWYVYVPYVSAVVVYDMFMHVCIYIYIYIAWIPWVVLIFGVAVHDLLTMSLRSDIVGIDRCVILVDVLVLSSGGPGTCQCAGQHAGADATTTIPGTQWWWTRRRPLHEEPQR